MHQLIAIEGIDGAGKATQAALLARRLGGEVISSPDYESRTGSALRDHLTEQWSCKAASGACTKHTDVLVRQALMTVNRVEVQERVKAALKHHPVVLDRWWLSSLAYGQVEGLDRAWLLEVSKCLLQPDFWIYVDVPGHVGAGRRVARDSNERDVEKLERVRQTYLSEVRQMPRAFTVGGDRHPDIVEHRIWTIVRKRFAADTGKKSGKSG